MYARKVQADITAGTETVLQTPDIVWGRSFNLDNNI